jgi:hypothetical protein
MRIHRLSVFVLVSVTTLAQSTPEKQNNPSQQVQSAETKTSATRAKEAREPEPTSSVALPVKRVVLYKNGVGYFEHTGRVRGSQDLGIEFTTAQLNDVLKSLTLVDLSGGRITGVRYNSVAPLEERLKSLQIPLNENVTSAAFLIALRGTRVEVRNGAASALGKVFSVETVQKETVKGGAITVTQLGIVTDAGELRVFELGPGMAVRSVDSEIHQDVNRYLNLVGSTRSKDVRRMTISATGSGERDLFVSYISEVPVWKSTYRIVLPKAPGTPFLQGWAIIDNTVGEDWKDVQLALMSGAPQSFVQDISQPYYTRRPVVALPESMMLTPQAHEASMEESNRLESSAKVEGGVPGGVAAGVMGGVVGGVGSGSGGGSGGGSFSAGPAMPPNRAMLSGRVADPTGTVVPNAEVVLRNSATGAVTSARTDSNGNYNFSGAAPGLYSLSISGQGFQTSQFSQVSLRPGYNNNINATLNVGSAAETIEVSSVNTSQNSMVTSALRGANAAAEGSALGELFQYSLKEKITVLKNQSALVPIVQSPIDAEKVTLVTANENGDVDGTPLRALWVTNSSGLTLDGGTFNILEQDSFAGEGIMEVLHPGERRLLSYAADTAVHVTGENESESRAATRVTILHGVMKIKREERDATTYTIHNADTTPRQVVVEHPIREGWKLAEDLKPAEAGSSHYRFRVAVGPDKTEKLVVNESRPEESSIFVSTITDNQVAALVQEKTIKAPAEAALRKVIDKKNEIAGVDQEIRSRQAEMESIDHDQARLRENMKALKGSAEEKTLLQRYTKQLDGQEDRLAELQKEIKEQRMKRAALQSQLDAMVEVLALDETL